MITSKLPLSMHSNLAHQQIIIEILQFFKRTTIMLGLLQPYLQKCLQTIAHIWRNKRQHQLVSTRNILQKTLSKFNEFIFTSSLSTVKTVILGTENRVSSFILWPYCPSVHSTQCHQLVPLLWIPEPGLALASSSATSLGFLLSSATRHFQGSQPLLSILHTKKQHKIATLIQYTITEVMASQLENTSTGTHVWTDG